MSVAKKQSIRESIRSRAVREEEGEPKTATTSVRHLLESRNFQLLSTTVTMFALYGNDLRLAATFSTWDPLFYALFILCLLYFLFEITLMSTVVEDYRWSFFFW